MKVIGYIPLYYGAEYLEASIKSIAPHVDRLLIVYTDQPSQGYNTNIPCPEDEKTLRDIALNASDKVEWHKGVWGREADHRDYFLQHAAGFDLMITIDADEVLGDDVQQALEYAYNGKSRRYGVDGFINFWRNFNHVCLDGFRPVRIMNLNNPDGEESVKMTIYHFGCAQKEEIMRFKWNVSGHKSEVRDGWLDDVFYAWTPDNNFGDLHVVSRNLWNAVEFDKETLPELLKQHPNFNKDAI